MTRTLYRRGSHASIGPPYFDTAWLAYTDSGYLVPEDNCDLENLVCIVSNEVSHLNDGLGNGNSRLAVLQRLCLSTSLEEICA